MRRPDLIPICLLAITAGACASGGAVPRPFPRSGEQQAPPSRIADALPGSNPLVGTALSLRGAPYKDGGNDPSGFDCSGFVEYVFAHQGQFVPRTVAEQYQLGSTVARGALEPGDLVFFSTTSSGPTHVGIAISPSDFVHAPSASGVVRVESLSAPYWSSRFLGARRVP